MQKFRKCWDKEKNDFLIKHKDLLAIDCWNEFLKAFPDTDISYVAFKNQRSRIKAVPYHNLYVKCTKARPLGSEQQKKGYVLIKVAQPNVWMQKSRWCYEKYHECKLPKNTVILFLDGDNKNFSEDNLYAVKHGVIAVLNGNYGGCVKGDPAATLLRIKQAELHMTMLEAARKAGMCNSQGYLKSVAAERTRKRRNANKEKVDAQNRASYKKRMEWLRINDPEKYEARIEKIRKYKREWARRKREKGNLK